MKTQSKRRLLVATAVAVTYGLAAVQSASAITWACGSYTCHDPPCNAGETSLPNGDGPHGEYNYAHCVAITVSGGPVAHKLGEQLTWNW